MTSVSTTTTTARAAGPKAAPPPTAPPKSKPTNNGKGKDVSTAISRYWDVSPKTPSSAPALSSKPPSSAPHNCDCATLAAAARRRRRRRRRLREEREEIEASADRLARLLGLGEVPKVRPYGKEGFMSMAVTHEMFAIDEAFAPLSSPHPRPVSTNPVWSCFAAKYLLPTVSSFHACPTPWSDYAATLHACERTLYWSKFCEGGAAKDGNGRGGGRGGEEPERGEESWLGGQGEEGKWTKGCASMATVQARRMVEWPFDPRKTADGTWFLSACSFLSVLLCWSRRAPNVVIGPYLARTLSSRIRSLLNACPSPPPSTNPNANTTTKTKTASSGVLSHPYDRPMLERLMTFLPLPEPLGRDAVGFGREAGCCGKEGCARELGDGLGYEGSGKGVGSRADGPGSGWEGTRPHEAAAAVLAGTPPPPSNDPTTTTTNGDGANAESELKQCSACRAIVYCGRQHQKDDWRKRHGKHCWGTAITGTAPYFGALAPSDDEDEEYESGEEEEDGDGDGDGEGEEASTFASESYDGSESSASSTNLGLPPNGNGNEIKTPTVTPTVTGTSNGATNWMANGVTTPTANGNGNGNGGGNGGETQTKTKGQGGKGQGAENGQGCGGEEMRGFWREGFGKCESHGPLCDGVCDGN